MKLCAAPALVSLAALLAAAPALAQAPADGWVVWQSNRQDSQNEIYLAAADGSGVTRLTTTGAQRPRFAPDGRWISFQGFGSDENTGYVMRPDGSGRKKICDGLPRFWLHDNTGLVCEHGDDFDLYDPDTGASTVLFRRSDFGAFGTDNQFSPGGVTHDNRYLVVGTDLYRPGHKGDNGVFQANFAAVILDLAAPERIYFFGSGCWPFTPPAGTLVYHICGDCPTHPDIYRMDLADLMTRSSYAAEKAADDADWGHEYNPDISNDNRWLAYMASTGCHSGYTCDYEIFLHRLGAGTTQRVRVTNEPRFDGYPSIHIGELWRDGESWLALVPGMLTLETADTARIEVRNAGSGSLGAVTTTVSYEGSSTGWLAVTPTGAGNSQELALTVDRLALAPGVAEHRATIEVTASNAANGPLSCPVTLRLAGTGPGGDGGPGGADASPVPSAPSGGGCSVGRAVGPTAGPSVLLLLGCVLLLRRQVRRVTSIINAPKISTRASDTGGIVDPAPARSQSQPPASSA